MSYESVQEMFSRTAAKFAAHTAIERGARRVTYGDVEAESSRLANFLLASGAGKGTMVGLFTDDPIRIITGLLGVLKAGAVFVPLDPTFPEGRLRVMSERVEPQWYVSEAKHLEKLGQLDHAEARVVCLDDGDYLNYERREHPDVTSDPEAPCSIYFTSGSTGKPKAILGRLKGIDHFMRWEIEAVGAGPGTRVSQLASPSFDGFLKDAFVPLCSGGVVCAPESRDLILDAWSLADWLDTEQVEVLHCVPSLFRALLNEGLASRYFEALKCVVMTGEPLYPADVKRWMDVFGDRVKLFNIYGTTETSLSKFVYEIKAEDVERPSIPVGKPIEGSRGILINSRGQLCREDAVGEIHIQTPYRSHGYYGEPELTREVFIQNPFSDDPTDIVHKTGDYGRLLKGGDLEHLGRRDQQVQVRGVRVELGEIENLLRAHSTVADVAVIDRDDNEGNKFLVAYVTLTNGTGSGPLREYLEERLPATMLPSAFVELDQLPRTLNGKIDRKALPTLEFIRTEPGKESGPLTPIEEIVAGIWCEVLRLPTVGRHRSFFNLGGHSLLVTQVLARVREHLKVKLPVRSLFEAPTLDEFARLIQEQISHGRQSELTPIPRASREGELPLSFAQQRMWFVEQLSKTTAFHIPLQLRLKGPLNQSALEQAVAEIMRRHENLRTSFPSRNGEPFQVIHAPLQAMFPVVDLHGLDPVEQESTARSLSEAQLNRPFDLTTRALTRLTLLRYSEDEHMVLCTLHHIISDGWSRGLLVNEISELYEAFCQGKPSPLKQLTIQYADFAAWQREWLSGDALDQELAYWKQNLTDAPPLLPLATDRPRPPVQTFKGATEAFTLSKDISQQLKGLSQQHSVTLFMSLLAAFQVMLHRYTSQDDLVVGTTVANRERSEVEGLIGFFVNMLALRVDCSANPRFDEFLKQVRETTLNAYAHQRLPFEKLVEELQPERNLSYSPLFQVIFSLQNQPTLTDLTLSGLTLSFPQAEVTTSQCDLLLDMWEGSDGLAGGLQYNSDLFDQSTAVRMVKHFRNLLQGIVTNPEQRLSELPLLNEDEQIQTLSEWNQTHAEYPGHSCIHELFESQVETAPDSIAAVFRDDHLSYAELNRRANQIARYLQFAGVKAGDLAGICLEHSFEELAGLLGVLKAGAAYLPLDLDHPAERLSFMLRDAGVTVVLTQQSFADALLAGDVRSICVDTEWMFIAEESDSNLNTGVPVESIAYVIYTSGSTGEPKGVAVPHQALGNYVWWAKDTYLRGEELAFPLYSSLAFDLTATSIFVPLISGNRVVVYRAESNVAPLSEVLRENQAGIMKLTPSHLSLIKEEDNRGSGIKRLIVGGEALRTQLAWEVNESFGGVEIYNEYGPTEATVGCMIYKVDAVADSRAFVPIGQPAANARIYVLGRGMSPVAENMIGEIYIGGDGLSQGYLEQRELTAERFLPDPFSTSSGQRMYRTGDLARRLPGGALEFLGRNDEQVKIRGFRVEPGEIEAVLGELAEVAEAVVLARADERGEKALVGYVVAAAGYSINPQALREQLAQRLPGYLVPSAIVPLEMLPLTANGKLDRQALPQPEYGGSTIWRAPRTPQEEILCALFAEVLNVPRVGLDDQFFELGGHSLLATRLFSLVRATLGVELPIRTLFESPTVAQLSLRLREASVAERIALRPQARPARLPLSYAQQRLWFLDQLEGVTPEYNMPVVLRLRGELAPVALEQAVNLIVSRHESLRTHFVEVEGEPQQVIAAQLNIAVPVEDLSGLDEARQQGRVRGWLAQEASEPFDLARGPVLRLRLLKLGADDHLLLRTMHHIVSDGWSEEVFSRELMVLYQALREGRPHPLPPLSVQYADFALWQRQWLEAEVSGGLAYWRQQLAGIPERLELPTDRPRPALQTFAAALCQTRLTAAQAAGLKQLSRSHHATVYMTLLAVFGVLLQRYSGQDDIVVGSPIANRQEAQLESLIGFFVNTLCLRVRVQPEQSFSELLSEVRRTALAAYEHQDVPFERLVEELSPQRSLNTTPVFQVGFAMQNAPRVREQVPGLEIESVRGEELRVRYDLEVHAWEEQGELGLNWLYNRDLFAGWRMEQMARHYLRLLEVVASAPEQCLGSIDLLDVVERQQMLEQWNDTTVELAAATLPELFEAQVGSTPDAVAVVSETQQLTYAELNQHANRLAHYVRTLNVTSEAPCAILLERSPEMVISMLAILKSGAAYVPLDPAYPPDRLSFMMQDSSASVLICNQALADRLPEHTATVVNLDSEADLIAQQSDANPTTGLKPDDLSHIIYTSGSTGQPKGVSIAHDSGANLLQWAHRMFTREELSGVLASTSICFDLSVFEIFAPLSCGGTVILAGNAINLATLTAAERVTLINTVPSAMAELLRMKAVGPGVCTVNLAGEPLKQSLVRQLYAETRVARVVNLYGPTEYTTYSTGQEVDRGNQQEPSIGRPVTNTQVYVVDNEVRPVPIGVVGEICIGGRGLAQCYLSQSAMTAERFIPDDFSRRVGTRLFRTGDLGKYLENGEIDYLGRQDHQVKIRGFRVEPGEIEAALGELAEVAEAVVLARADERGEKALVGYVVAAAGYSINPQALREQLAQRLPGYLVPSAIVALEALPLTANGKLDRQALPQPEYGGSTIWRAPRTPQEEILCALFAEVLNVPRVGLDDQFFELGGHSLLATRLFSLVRATLGVELPIRTLFESPTVAQLSLRLREASVAERIALRPQARPARLPLSYAQQRLWFLDQLEGVTPEYNMPVALRLRGELAPAALEQAVNLIVSRHESLRTHFVEVEGEPQQVIVAQLNIAVPLEDLSGLDEARQQARVRGWLAQEASEPFDLARGPVLRLRLLKLGADDHLLLRTMHHIVSDGWSEEVFSRELMVLYQALREGRPHPLPPLSVQYADFALWQRQWLEAEVSGGLAYWRQQLAGIPERLELPTDRPRPALQTFAAALCQTRLTAAQAAGLKQLSRSHHATVYMTLLAVFGVLLQRYSGQDDIVVGSPIANRQEAQLESLIGFFVNTLCLRVRVQPELSFSELLSEVRRTALAAYEHQDVPFERLVEELSPQRSLNTTPVFQVGFAMQNAPRVREQVPGLEIESVRGEELRVRYDLEVHAWEEQGELGLNWIYNRDLFAGWRMEQMARHYLRLLEVVASAPEQCLGSIDLLDVVERQQMLEQWNDTTVELAAATLPELFEAQVGSTPDAVAVVSETQQLTYAELNQHANCLAHLLIAHGIGPEDVVALAVPSSPEMIVSLLGILKAGAAYLPIDTNYPPARVAFMLANAEPACVITLRETVAYLPDSPRRLILDDPDTIRALAECESHNSERTRTLDPHNPAYVIYTSGSTGEPKGVAVPHRALVNYVWWAKDTYLRGEELAFPLYSSLAFDLTATSIFVPLISGNRVVVYRAESNVAPLSEVLRENQAGIMKLTPSHLSLIKEEDNRGSGIKRLIVGGEALRTQVAWEVNESFGGVEIYNEYGPTEATVGCMIYKFDAVADSGEAANAGNAVVSIGTPIQNAQVYVLDDTLNPAAAGVIGELYIGGAGLARGYLRRPDLTAERFVTDPFGVPGARMYRTGDRVRWRPDGNLEFLGRLDEQVKIRGFRIELGEIETTLRQYPAVREAAVMARQDLPDDKRLVAYVVPEPLPQQSDSGLQQAEQVEQWQTLFDEMQTRTLPNLDPTFNIIGWDSSYTGQPLPDEEMHEWLDSTVARILDLQPQRVLEIGCGTGLLLFRIAPTCTRYWATDFSSATLAQLQLIAGDRELPVKLLPRNADNFTEIEAEAFDTVIINSVSQYFPNVDYLVRVLEGAVNAVAAGGAVFIGDVRSLPLLSAFHVDVLMSKADAQLSKVQFAQQLHKQVRIEKELLVDPEFFTALRKHLPRITRVEVQLKRGHYRNELTQFRYDVTLHVGPEADAFAAEIEWLDWQQQSLTLTEVRRLLEETNAPALGITRVPNARLHSANQILAWLDSDDGPKTAGEFRDSIALHDSATDPEQIWALSHELPYNPALSWSTDDSEGRYDVLFTRAGTVAPLVRRPAMVTASRPLNTYANNPLQGNFYRQLVVELRRFVKERLPDYMAPSAIMVLESLPLTTHGKIDWRALPPPDQSRPELEKAYVAPRTPAEEVLATLWANVLGLDRVGIYDNFFDLGGHSLLATQLVSRVRNLFQVEAPLRWMFDASTVAAFSQTLIANEPRPGQTDKIALTFQKVKAMKLETKTIM